MIIKPIDAIVIFKYERKVIDVEKEIAAIKKLELQK